MFRFIEYCEIVIPEISSYLNCYFVIYLLYLFSLCRGKKKMMMRKKRMMMKMMTKVHWDLCYPWLLDAVHLYYRSTVTYGVYLLCMLTMLDDIAGS